MKQGFFLAGSHKGASKALAGQTVKHILMLLSYNKKKNSMALDHLMEVKGITWPMSCLCSCLPARQSVTGTKVLCFGH